MIAGWDNVQKLLRLACCDDPHAVRFCESVWKAAHLWDDIKDGDAPEDVDATFAGITTDLLINPFVVAHQQACASVMSLIIANWQTANGMEASGTSKEKSYMLRAQLYNLPVLCAFILKGQAWANHISSVSWECYGETVDSFLGGKNA